jgi:aminocarboxymuconate-semialdehyde decarboxylase
MTTIDFHAHILERDVLRRCGNNSVMHGFGARPVPPPDPDGPFAGAFERMLDPDLQLADMDRRGIDMSVISTSTIIQNTGWAEPALQAELEGQANDEIARWVGRSPDRFVGSFTLPLRDLDLALAELARCTGDLGLRVAALPAAVDGVYLGARDFRPLWEAFQDLGVVAFIHPDGVRDPWFQEYSLWNSVGQPIEEAKVMASLILEGVLEDLPELTIVMAHGGGYLPHYFGRLDRNVTNMPHSVRNISGKPSDYLRAFHLDTCVYDVSILDALIRRVGADRLVLGSDYPVGDPDPVGFVRRSTSLADGDLEMVCSSTAMSLLSLPTNGQEDAS